MKVKSSILFLLLLTLLQPCIAQKTPSTLPKIEGYSKGELEIKVTPFGLENPIQVGEITADGNIHFNWDNDITSIKDPEFFMSSIKNTLGMTFCNDKAVEQDNKEAKSVDTNGLFLYKNGQQVGALLPATQKEMEDNKGANRSTSLVLGSSISWFYSDSDVIFNGKCGVNFQQENVYDFSEVTSYTIDFKKGWNMVLNTLVEKEDWKNDAEIGSLPKTMTKASIAEIPNTINWYLNYWANDEDIEKQHRLALLTPISEKQFQNWLPNHVKDFKRTSYQINKMLERSKSKSNVFLVFEKENQKIELVIIDGAESPYDLETVQIAFEMSDSFKEQGYASKQNENTTELLYAIDNRIVVMVKGNDITSEELWATLENLQFEKLMKQ